LLKLKNKNKKTQMNLRAFKINKIGGLYKASILALQNALAAS
jgi:hypothetical protein